MGKVIHVASFDDMGKAAKTLQNLSETYTQIYTQLLQEASTMGSAWDGADNLAFVERINGFTDELKAMAEKLHTCSVTLDTQRANYVERQESNITTVNKLIN